MTGCPKRHVRFSRFNVFARDKNTCQYCGGKFARSELNLDHVIPRSRGGLSTWENVVCSCFSCNRIKGGRLPRRPYASDSQAVPARVDAVYAGDIQFKRYQEWLPYLNPVDAAY